MSALGQKQTWKRVRVMSALPPKADISSVLWDVRFVPKADILRCGKEVEVGQESDSAVAGRPTQHSGGIGGRITAPSDDLIGSDQCQIGLIDVAGLVSGY